MKIVWGEMLTIFIAIVLASIVEHKFLKKSSPAAAIELGVVYTNPLDKFVATHYKDATTI